MNSLWLPQLLKPSCTVPSLSNMQQFSKWNSLPQMINRLIYICLVCAIAHRDLSVICAIYKNGLLLLLLRFCVALRQCLTPLFDHSQSHKSQGKKTPFVTKPEINTLNCCVWSTFGLRFCFWNPLCWIVCRVQLSSQGTLKLPDLEPSLIHLSRSSVNGVYM